MSNVNLNAFGSMGGYSPSFSLFDTQPVEQPSFDPMLQLTGLSTEAWVSDQEATVETMSPMSTEKSAKINFEETSQTKWRRSLMALATKYERQQDLATELDIEQATLSKLLLGKKPLTRKMMFRIGQLSGSYDWYEMAPSTHQGARLRDYLLFHGIDQQDFAARMGQGESTISVLLNKDFFKPAKWHEIEQALETTRDQILADLPIGKIIKIKPDESSMRLHTEIRPYFEDEDEMIEIPLLPEYARAGLDAPRYFEQPMETMRININDIPVNMRKRKWWGITVNGDSMEPQLQAGDKVLCYWLDRDEWDKVHNRVAIVQFAGMVVIKRIKANRIEQEGGLWLHSDNPQAEPFFVQVQDLQNILLVVSRTGNVH